MDASGTLGYFDASAGVAQLVEHELPKLGVAGSIPVSRSRKAAQSRGLGSVASDSLLTPICVGAV